MCILKMSKVLVSEFHYDYIKNRYGNNSRLLFTDTDSLTLFWLGFRLDAQKLRGGGGGGGGGVGKKYLVIDDDNREHKEPKDVNRNAVATKSLNEHKDVFLNNKCLRYSVNRIQSKDHGIGTYEINKILLSCFHDKI